MLKDRITLLKEGTIGSGAVVYWMQRDQRVDDNWALLFTQQIANEHKRPIIVLFCLTDEFGITGLRQFSFMIEGLKETASKLEALNIQFHLLLGKPQESIPKFLREKNAASLISDFNPLKIVQECKEKIKEKISIPFYEVDAHNIVPCRIASNKLEYAAYTIRPKIKKLLPQFLEPFPKLNKHEFPLPDKAESIKWTELINKIDVDKNVKPVDWIKPGEINAGRSLQNFLNTKLSEYSSSRNDPNKDAVSNLSPYLHFGQISAQRIALEILPFIEHKESQESFLEELIIRKELADNFCFYNPDYDKYEGFHDWAKKTLNEHRIDKRDYVYGLDEFENAKTHDPLWNAAQTEMVTTGKMHGFMRMYWAKKILEWTESPEEAMRIAINLNDKYELDGSDPNGYAGIAWSIGGVHDRAWTERPVFGKVRYMNYNGCKRKFNVNNYINTYS